MKNSGLFFSFVALLALAFTNPVAVDNYAVDTGQSSVTWKGYKVTGSHTGNINIQNGSLDFDNGQLTGGQFTIDMASITCTDLDGGYKDKLEGHLKSADFFGVDEHPTAAFAITKVVSRGTPGDYKITGNLTIKNITKEIRFLANVQESANGAVATADIKVDRSDFNVRYGSGSFFDNLGDKTIYDEFDLTIKLVTSK